MPLSVDDVPKAKVFRERIGDIDYELREENLALDQVILWPSNPRLQPFLADARRGESSGIESEEQLEDFLRRTNGYQALVKSINSIGQMEPIYAWKRDDQEKYLIIEGATRVTILRELNQRNANRPEAGKFARVKAKILPPEFNEEHRAILLARIHVRGTGVRAWGRYIEAKFVYDTVNPINGRPALMNLSQLAGYLEKSVSWVSRLHAAYEFARKFIEQDDSPDVELIAVKEFSTLEEISKAPSIGPKVRDYSNSQYDTLRSDVFDMVRNGVFKEYRDARFMKEFYEDPEKWAILKDGQKDSANQLANEIRVGGKGIRGRIDGLGEQIERAFDRDDSALGEHDVESLRRALASAERFVHPGVRPIQLALVAFTKLLQEASLVDVRSVQPDQYKQFRVALEDFEERLKKHREWT